MSERAASYTPPLQVPQAADGSVRPKVMRRPTQFANKALPAQPLPALLAQTDAAERTKTVLHARAWQDDGRFAITLLAIVIVINVLVSAWLSAIAPTATPSTAIPLISSAPDERNIVHILDDAAAAGSNQ